MSATRLEVGDSATFDVTVTCIVCKKQLSRYTCPRCRARYCSAVCYKTHGLSCTESFFKEQVVDNLRTNTTTNEERQRTLEMLRKYEETVAQEEKDGAECEVNPEFVGTALERMHFDENTVLEDLNPDQLAAFRAAVDSGCLDHIVRPWNPWWNRRSPEATGIEPLDYESSVGVAGKVARKDIRDREEDNDDQDEQSEGNETEEEDEFPQEPSEMPKVASDIPALVSLTRKAPATQLWFNLANVICSYCLVLRLSNGDVAEDPAAVVADFMQVSEVLGVGTVFSSVADAVQAAAERAVQPPTAASQDLCLTSIADAGLVVCSRTFVLAALSHLQHLFQQALEAAQGGQRLVPRARVSKQARKAQEQAERRLFFMLAWANERSLGEFEQLSVALQRQWQLRNDVRTVPCAARVGAGSVGSDPGAAGSRNPPKVLIQEVTATNSPDPRGDCQPPDVTPT